MPADSMLRLQTLGNLELTRAGRPVQSIMAQPRRLALLTYLAVAGSGRFVRRDLLLAMFWPESDDTKARNALNQTVHRLRTSLGSDVIVSRGRDELSVSSDLLWCDATQLAAAPLADVGPLAETLYRGPFLPGFHVGGSIDFERWVEETRRSLSRRARRGLLAMAEQARAAGESARVEALVERAELIEPVEPELAARLTATLPIAELPSRPPLPAASTARSDGRISAARSRTRPSPMQAGVALVACLVIALVAWISRGDQTGPLNETAERDGVAVLPFEVFGPGLDEFGEGMVPLLTANLDQLQGRGSFRPAVVLRVWEGLSKEEEGGQLPERLAARLGASHTISGTITAADSTVRILSELRDKGGDVHSVVQVDGARANLISLVDSLTVGLVQALWGLEAPVPQMRLEAIATGSVNALAAFVKGERHRRKGAWGAAVAAYEDAIALDTAFALAQLRLFESRSWLLMGLGSAESTNDLGRLAELTGRLPPREQELARAWIRWSKGEVASVDSTAALIERYPDDPMAWTVYGETLVHSAPFIASPQNSIRAVFAKVLELDPTTPDGFYHALILAMAAGDSAGHAALLGSYRATGLARGAELHDALGQIRWGNTQEGSATYEQARRSLADPGAGFLFMGNLLDLIWATMQRVSVDPATDAEPLLKLLAELEEASASASTGNLVRHLRARALVELGRAHEGMSLLVEAAPPPPWLPPVASTGALLGLIPGELAGRQDGTEPPGPAASVPSALASLEEGIRVARAGKPDRLRAIADELRRSAPQARPSVPGAPGFEGWPPLPPESHEVMALAFASLAAIQEGDIVKGDELFQEAIATTGLANLLGYALLLPMFEYAKGMARTSYGYTTGIDMLEAFARSNAHCCTTALSYLAMAEAHEVAGDAAAASEAYSRVVNLWRGADPHLAGLRNTAQLGRSRNIQQSRARSETADRPDRH